MKGNFSPRDFDQHNLQKEKKERKKKTKERKSPAELPPKTPLLSISLSWDSRKSPEIPSKTDTKTITILFP